MKIRISFLKKMHNTLTDVSIVTMIGNLPEIINRNNQAVKDEFNYVFMYDDNGQNPKLTTDVNCNSVTAHTGYFQNLNFNGIVLNSSLAYNYNQINATIKDFETRISKLENETTILGSQQNIYGAMNEDYVKGLEELDMSALFSVKGDGVVMGVSLDDIYKFPIYRKVEEQKIPLQIGTAQEDKKIFLTFYHDHMTSSVLQRIYVPIKYDMEHNAIVQAGAAQSVTIK